MNSWTKLLCLGLGCALVVPAGAAPTIVVTPGALLEENRQWEISVAPDVDTFVPNSSLAVEIDLQFAPPISAIISYQINDSFWNVDPVNNVGNNPFTGTVTGTVLDTAPFLDTLFIAAGSELFTTATAVPLATISTSAYGRMSWGGRTVLPGTPNEYTSSRVAQNALNYDGLSGSVAVCGSGGDLDCDGRTANSDLTLVLNNWGKAVPPSPAGWYGVPPTAPAVDNDELTLMLNNWGATGDVIIIPFSAGGASAVPEPTAIFLAGLGVCGLGLATTRQRRPRDLA